MYLSPPTVLLFDNAQLGLIYNWCIPVPWQMGELCRILASLPSVDANSKPSLIEEKTVFGAVVERLT